MIGFYPEERMALFIDNLNFHQTTRDLGISIDFGELKSHFAEKSRLIRCYFYAALPNEPEYTNLRPLVDWLSYNGFYTVTKLRKEFETPSGVRKIKGNMEMEIAIDALEISSNVESIVLFSGNGELTSLVKALQKQGVRVTVVSSTQTNTVSDDLRRAADNFMELADLIDECPQIARSN